MFGITRTGGENRTCAYLSRFPCFPGLTRRPTPSISTLLWLRLATLERRIAPVWPLSAARSCEGKPGLIVLRSAITGHSDGDFRLRDVELKRAVHTVPK